MTALIILCSLILASMIVLVIFTVLTYNRIMNLVIVNGAYQAEEYRQAVGMQKQKKPNLEPVKEKVRGRKIERVDNFMNLSELDPEEGIRALEELTNG